jgi:hypothetical protein
MAPSMDHVNHPHAFQIEKMNVCQAGKQFPLEEHSDCIALTNKSKRGELRRIL